MGHFQIGIGLLTLLVSALVIVPRAVAFNPIPKSLTFIAVEGGSNPASQGVTISNNPNGHVNWATSYTPLWLRITLSPWQIVPSDQLLVSVDITGMAAGVYSGTISIAAPKGASISIPVTLRIAPRKPSSVTLTPIDNSERDSAGRLTSASPY